MLLLALALSTAFAAEPCVVTLAPGEVVPRVNPGYNGCSLLLKQGECTAFFHVRELCRLTSEAERVGTLAKNRAAAATEYPPVPYPVGHARMGQPVEASFLASETTIDQFTEGFPQLFTRPMPLVIPGIACALSSAYPDRGPATVGQTVENAQKALNRSQLKRYLHEKAQYEASRKFVSGLSASPQALNTDYSALCPRR